MRYLNNKQLIFINNYQFKYIYLNNDNKLQLRSLCIYFRDVSSENMGTSFLPDNARRADPQVPTNAQIETYARQAGFEVLVIALTLRFSFKLKFEISIVLDKCIKILLISGGNFADRK